MEEQKIKTHYLQGQNEKAVTREHFMIEKCSLCAWSFGWSGMKGCCMLVDGAVFDKVLGRAQAGTTWLRSRNEKKKKKNRIQKFGAWGQQGMCLALESKQQERELERRKKVFEWYFNRP